MTTDPVDLTTRLVQCPSVTPVEGGALDLLQSLLTEAGFACTRVPRGGIDNLFARWGAQGHAKSFGFNGHTDVVPIGDEADWSVDPFGGTAKDGKLWGRGATDMKSGVAAFAAAAIDFVADTPPEGAIILTITGDEEADALHGTRALLDWMGDNDEAMTVCLVGEPTCPENLGDMIKVGRRGSLTAHFTATGIQGHSAYPHKAKNPVPAMARLMDRLASHPLDEGTDHFDPSTLAVTTIDVGNPATNVIPAKATATVNIRFNDAHSLDSLIAWMEDETASVAQETGIAIEIDVRKGASQSFLTPPGPLSDLVAQAVETQTGRKPELSTTGGTSDARFVKDHCPVVEFGLVGKTMHEVDEHVDVQQIRDLKAVYSQILQDYFA